MTIANRNRGRLAVFVVGAGMLCGCGGDQADTGGVPGVGGAGPAGTSGTTTGGQLATSGSEGSGTTTTTDAALATSDATSTSGTTTTLGASSTTTGAASTTTGTASTTTGTASTTMGAASTTMGDTSSTTSTSDGTTSDAATSTDSTTGAGGSTAATSTESTTTSQGSGGTGSTDCTTPPQPSQLVGWAAVSGNGLDTTTGGGNAAPVTVTTTSEFSSAVSGSNPAVVLLDGDITGNVSIGSNKTVIGICGAQFTGHLGIGSSSNVIVRNLRIVGYNCSDSPSDCSAGADAITISSGAHHIWFDHDDILDGSDGNLDIVHGSDFVTISWTKFSYSSRRTDPAAGSSGHRFSNLIGNSDSLSSEDGGHLNVTFHHVWWTENVDQRMPRIRFGKIHVFNSLYTATNNNYAIGPGVDASVRSENNVFISVTRPINTTSFLNGNTTWTSVGNIYTSSDSPADNGTAFTPPYNYTPDPADTVEASVRAGAGPQ